MHLMSNCRRAIRAPRRECNYFFFRMQRREMSHTRALWVGPVRSHEALRSYEIVIMPPRESRADRVS